MFYKITIENEDGNSITRKVSEQFFDLDSDELGEWIVAFKENISPENQDYKF